MRVALLLIFLVQGAWAQSVGEFEKAVTEFTLANGMHFIVVERHQVPIVSFDLYVDVGGADDPSGQTGLAHMFEHLAFKGTSTIGTTNYAAEKKAMDALDAVYARLQAERDKAEGADKEKIKQLEAEFDKTQKEAEQYEVPDEFTEIIERAGGVGLNAQTSADNTRYFLSLPSNKLELWFTLESSRFLDPVLRDFYKERDVVREERRMRVESEPTGRLLEDFTASAYKAHPYKEPVVGWSSDILQLTRPQAEAYFKQHYVAAAMSACIVGDVDPKEARRLAELYFGRLPKRPRPEPIHTIEPAQDGQRRVLMTAESQPYLVTGYHRSSVRDPNRNTLDAISDILGGGRTSWLYQSLVKEKQIAVDTEAITGYPGFKYPGLFIFAITPSTGHTADEAEKATDEQVERIKKEKITADLLAQVKRRARASVIRGLNSNSGLASALNDNYMLLGDWRYLFRDLDLLDKITADDIQSVAKTFFQRSNETVGVIVPSKQ